MVKQGDIIKIDFSPTVGREQDGYRPAIVLSKTNYNQRTGSAIICPITNNIGGSALKDVLPDGLPVTGAIISDQIRYVDLNERPFRIEGELPLYIVKEISDLIHKLTDI